MAEPYDIKSPEEIAKAYGGNKQQIAQAMQLGVVDPTAGVLAGMFIDRMRAAQTQEAVPQATVAQQVMGGAPAAQGAPPASSSPAGGLGAIPQAAPPMAPQGMPPQMDQGMAPQGMAAGGSVPPYASGGGLSDVPIPDTMFDEPSNGGFGDGYAGGGIVAFKGGSPGTLEDDFDAEFGPRMVQPTPGPTYYGYSATDPMANLATYQSLFGTPQTKYSDEYEQELLKERSPEARKKARDTDLGYALMLMGSRMASTPGGLLQSASAALGAGAPALMQMAKERKAEDREIRKGLLDLEAGRNTAAAQKANALIQMQQMGVSGAEAEAGRKSQFALQELKNKGDIAVEQLRQRGEDYRAALRASGSGGGSGTVTKPLSAAQATERLGKLSKQADQILKTALEYDKAKDIARTGRAFEEYGKLRAAYKMIAEPAGMPELPKPNYGAFTNYNAYMKQNRPKPSGPQVKDGFILRSATDIPSR